jgi:hypothetical protein
VTIEERVFTREEETEFVAVISHVRVTVMVALKLPLGENDIEALTEFDGVLKDDGESETVVVGEFDGNGDIDIFITLGVNIGVPVT